MNRENILIEEVSDENEDFTIKVVIVGNSGVGKSNLLSRFVQNEFSNDSRATVGVELLTKSYRINKKIIKLHLWDTAGQERFKSITSSFYKGSKGAIIVYDITNRESFTQTDKWLSEIKDLADRKIDVIICGNKCDLEQKRKVSTEEGLLKCNINSIGFFETSALNSVNIDEAFKYLIKEIYESSIKLVINNDNLEISKGETLKFKEKKKESSKKRCCSVK